MWAVNNFISSKSDNSIGLRPDFYPHNVYVRGMSADLNLQTNDDTLDVLNSVTGVYGSTDVVYFTTYIPWGSKSGAANDIICTTMSTGRAFAAADSFSVTFTELGTYDIDQKWWRGCILVADGDYYVIDRVYASDDTAETGTVILTMPTQANYNGVTDLTSATYKWTASGSGTNEFYCELTAGGDPSLSDPTYLYMDDTLLVEGTLGSLADHEWNYGDNDTLGYNTVYVRDNTGDPDGSGVEIEGWYGVSYTVYRTHNPFRAGNNKIELNTGQNETIGASLIYCTPGIEDGISAENVSGPFYANVTESDWDYGSYQFVDTQGLDIQTIGTEKYVLATNGTSWLWVGMSGTVDDPTVIYKTLNISIDDAWTALEISDLTLTYPQPSTDDVLYAINFNTIVRDSTYGYLATVTYSTSSVLGADLDRTGIAYSSDDGVTWTIKPDDTYDDTDYVFAHAAHDGTTIACVVYNVGTGVTIRYSTDDGDNWATIAGDAPAEEAALIMKYLGGYFICCGQDENIYYSLDGQTFTEYDVSGDEAGATSMFDVAYNGNLVWLFSDATGGVYKVSTTPGGTYTDVSITVPASDPIDSATIFYDPVGQRFIVPAYNRFFTTADSGTNWVTHYLSNKWQSNPGEVTNIDYSGQIVAYINDGGTANDNQYQITTVLDRTLSTSYDVDDFTPISDLYRGQTFAIIDGYLILIGTREWETDEWVYHPKRIRWTSPGTYNDFTTAGQGTADVSGPGELIHAAAANGRVVIFETTRVSAIVPRGDTDDPFDYDVVNDNFRIISNPVAVNDSIYVIADDGLLWQTDGINCEEVGASFDITELDDYAEKKPIWLTYSRQQNSLYAYYRNTADTTHKAYVINLGTGGVSSVSLTEIDDNAAKAVDPGSVVAIEGSVDMATFCSHHPSDDDTDYVLNARLMVNTPIIGRDIIIPGGDSEYWAADVESGELYITQEGEKSSVKHIIVETYTAASAGDNTDRPYLAAEVKSIEDSDYATIGDTTGTATMTTTALTGSGTAWSTTIAGPNTGPTQQKCNGSTVAFTLPCLAAQARVYIDDVLYENYTTSGKVITCAAAPATSSTLKAYWENVPEVKVKVGDFFKSTEGWHRVTAITSAQDITLDHYLSTGSETVTHYPAWQTDDGHGRVEIGINRLVEGVQIRLYMIPDYNGTQQSTVAKITGLSIGYVPQGRKIVKATGS